MIPGVVLAAVLIGSVFIVSIVIRGIFSYDVLIEYSQRLTHIRDNPQKTDQRNASYDQQSDKRQEE